MAAFRHQKLVVMVAAMAAVSMFLFTTAYAAANGATATCKRNSLGGDNDLAASVAKVVNALVENTPRTGRYKFPVTKGVVAQGSASCSSSLGTAACQSCLIGIVGTLESKCLNAARVKVDSPDGCSLNYAPN